MTFGEFMGGFDKGRYTRSIQHLNKDQLQCEHETIRKKVIAATSVTIVGALSLAHTAGCSAGGIAMGWRRQHYNKEKQDAIEERMRYNGWPIPRLTTEDVIIAAGPAAIAGAIAPGAEHFIGHVAGHGAAAFTGHHVGDTINAASNQPSTFAHAMGDGALSQLHAVGEGVIGHTTPLVHIDAVASNTPGFLGYVAGQGAASAAELEALSRATYSGAEQGLNACRRAENGTARRDTHSNEKHVNHTKTRRQSPDAPSLDASLSSKHTTNRYFQLEETDDFAIIVLSYLPIVYDMLGSGIPQAVVVATFIYLMIPDRLQRVAAWASYFASVVVIYTWGIQFLRVATLVLQCAIIVRHSCTKVISPVALACIAWSCGRLLWHTLIHLYG